MMLSWWIFSIPHAMLPGSPYIMLSTLLYLPQIMLLCLILSAWCYAARCYLLHAALLHLPHVIQTCLLFLLLDIRTCLHETMPLDCLYLMSHCLTFATSCYFALPSPMKHVFQLDFVLMLLRCLMLSASCPDASHFLPPVKLLHVPYVRSR